MTDAPLTAVHPIACDVCGLVPSSAEPIYVIGKARRCRAHYSPDSPLGAVPAEPQKEPHTPGPWEIREVAFEATPTQKRRVYRVEIVAPQFLNGRRVGSLFVAQIVDYADWTDQPANARLIAAAPDLLQALKDTLTYWTCTGFADCEVDCDCIVDRARAAIAKAEGPDA